MLHQEKEKTIKEIHNFTKKMRNKHKPSTKKIGLFHPRDIRAEMQLLKAKGYTNSQIEEALQLEN